MRWCFLAAGILVGAAAVRFAYFGEWLPNTYYAKRIALDRAIPEAIEYLRYYLGRIDSWNTRLPGWWAAQGTLLLLFTALLIGASVVAVRRRDLLALPSAIIAQLAFIMVSGGDWMPFGRFLAPVSGLMAILAVLGIGSAWDGMSRLLPRFSVVWQGLGVAAVIWLVFFGIYTHPSSFRFAANDGTLISLATPGWEAAPRMLTCASPGSLVAYSEMGYGPWVRDDLRFIDLRGLADEYIARNPPHPGGRARWGVVDEDWTSASGPVARYVLSRRPAMVLVDAQQPVRGGPLLDDYRPTGPPIEGVQPFLRRDLDCRHR